MTLYLPKKTSRIDQELIEKPAANKLPCKFFFTRNELKMQRVQRSLRRAWTPSATGPTDSSTTRILKSATSETFRINLKYTFKGIGLYVYFSKVTTQNFCGSKTIYSKNIRILFVLFIHFKTWIRKA